MKDSLSWGYDLLILPQQQSIFFAEDYFRGKCIVSFFFFWEKSIRLAHDWLQFIITSVHMFHWPSFSCDSCDKAGHILSRSRWSRFCQVRLTENCCLAAECLLLLSLLLDIPETGKQNSRQKKERKKVQRNWFYWKADGLHSDVVDVLSSGGAAAR